MNSISRYLFLLKFLERQEHMEMISTSQNLVHKNVQMKSRLPTGMFIPAQHALVSLTFIQYNLYYISQHN